MSQKTMFKHARGGGGAAAGGAGEGRPSREKGGPAGPPVHAAPPPLGPKFFLEAEFGATGPVKYTGPAGFSKLWFSLRG